MVPRFLKLYLYINNYGPDDPNAERIFRVELSRARAAVKRCFKPMDPEDVSLCVNYWTDGARAVCDAIKQHYGKNYALDNDLASAYNDMLFDLFSEVDGEELSREEVLHRERSKQNALELLPQMIKHISFEEVQCALNQIEENVERGYFNWPRGEIRSLPAFGMQTEIDINMRIVIEFLARYSE